MKIKLSLLVIIIMGLTQMVWANTPIPHQINGYGFLRYHGVDVSKLNIIDGTFTIGEDTELYPLEGEQLIALLDDVRHMDYYLNGDGREGSYFIAGVHDNGFFSIVVYTVEYGDGGCIEMGIYDDNGKLWDFLNLGYWGDFRGCNLDDSPESDAIIHLNTTLTFYQDHTFTLNINGEMRPINDVPTQSNLKGTMTKTVQYGYKDRRYFELKDIDVKYSNPIMERFFPFADIDNLQYAPKSEVYDKLDTLNELIVRDDIASDIHNEEYSEANYMITQTLSQCLEMNTETVFTWLSYHHDPVKDHVMPFVKDCCMDGVADLGMIEDAISEFENNRVKNFAETTLNKWIQEQERVQ